jgi:hypothetical protein
LSKRRAIAARITTPQGDVFEAGREVAVFLKGEGQEKTIKATIDQVYCDGVCVVTYPAGISEFKTPLLDHLEVAVANLVLRDRMTPEAWAAMFPTPEPIKKAEADDVKRRGHQSVIPQKTVMTITPLANGVRFAASCFVPKFVEALKSQTRSRTYNGALGTWRVSADERAAAEKLALEHFDQVILVEGEGRRQLKPFPWQVKHQRG